MIPSKLRYAYVTDGGPGYQAGPGTLEESGFCGPVDAESSRGAYREHREHRAHEATPAAERKVVIQ